jgi:tRNA(Ile)-lysidine synthase
MVTKESFLIHKQDSQVNIPLKFTFCNVSDITDANSNCIFVDEDSLHFPLILRRWEEGDYFYPFGMSGKKKLSKYFKDEKITVFDKENLWLLCYKNHIVWIVGKRQDDRFKVTEATRKILKISLQT